MATADRHPAQSLDALVADCLRESEAALAARGVRVTRQLAPVPGQPMDATLIREAVGLLLAEAAGRVAKGRSLRVTVKANRNALMLAIKAAGAGIPDAQRDGLFTAGPLARVRQIAAAHRGVAWANGRPGLGITFYVTFPTKPEGEGIERET